MHVRTSPRRVTWLAIAVATAACQTKNEASKKHGAEPSPSNEQSASERPAPPKRTAPGGNATVAITLTGAIEKKLEGPIGFCAIPMIGGKASGATYQVSDGGVQLAILATSERELTEPKIVINTSGASYVLKTAATVAKLQAGASAEIEADLERVDAKETVHVKGTVSCN